ncbi:STP1 protein [Plasmodium ovale curtisi]|uniref:STP1 protein n=1 Tax=Plasmodium ovale curtisi TaxID=864141 RepID=A0A1A8X7E1_PLAOA|nr:STP1 protein [Plasmodium ovale curtisi]
MSKGSSYSTELEEIPIGTFIREVQEHIEDLFSNHGHRDCGLVHEDVCENIKDFIVKRKKSLLTKKRQNIVNKFNEEWERLKKKTYDDKFNEFGYENLCFAVKFKRNPRLRKLKRDFISFCQQKNARKKEVKSDDFNSCTNYNMWINAQKNTFDRDYLRIVKELGIKDVTNYFRTKTHPKVFDPRTIYNSNKLNCNELYSQSKKQLEKTGSALPIPTKSPEETSGGKKSKKPYTPITNGKTIISDIINLPNPFKSPSDNSQKNPPVLEKPKDVTDVQDTNSRNRDTLPPTTQNPIILLPPVASSIPPGHSALPPTPALSLPPVHTSPPTQIAQQTPDKLPTPVTHSTTSPTITQSLAPAKVPSQRQSPDAANHTPQTTFPDPAIKSPIPDVPSTTALDPGIASAPAAASNSSVSVTSSTVVSTTTASTAGSPPTQDPLVITVPPQSTTTTSIVTTPILTQTTAESGPSTTTVSAIGTQPIPSITENTRTTKESENPKAPIKTKSDPQDSISAPPKKQDDSTAASIEAQSPGTSANLNINPSPGQTLGPPAHPPPGLSSDISPERSPERSPEVSPDVSPDVHAKPTADDKKITTPTKYAAPHAKGTTLVSSTPLPKITYPSEKSSIAPTEFPPLMNIIPTTLILLATLTILFLLYKYTPFGLFLGRRRRKKKDLRTVFVIPEEPTYESPNETIHEWDDHNLGKQIMEKDVYVKLLKTNRYKKEMQKKKKKSDTSLIEVHMEILEECKNDEWELHKGDFLEICLQEFINEKNRTKTNWPNAELSVNNIKNDKTIKEAEKIEILWNFLIGNYGNILESWKSEEWFQNLKNEWKKERQKNQNKIDKIEENTLKESEMISIECEKDIWKKWISKQATLIEMFKQEDWFKSLIAEQDKDEDNYEINEYINVLNTNMNEFEKEKKYHEFFRKKNIINKLMVQMHMMVLEECKKEEIIENKELCIDDYIQNIHKKNNYDEKSYIL